MRQNKAMKRFPNGMIIFVQMRLHEVEVVSDLISAARMKVVVALTCDGSKCNRQAWRFLSL